MINSFFGGFQLDEFKPWHWDMRCRHPQWQLSPAHKAHPGFCAFPPKFPHTTLRRLLPGFSQEPERHPLLCQSLATPAREDERQNNWNGIALKHAFSKEPEVKTGQKAWRNLIWWWFGPCNGSQYINRYAGYQVPKANGGMGRWLVGKVYKRLLCRVIMK